MLSFLVFPNQLNWQTQMLSLKSNNNEHVEKLFKHQLYQNRFQRQIISSKPVNIFDESLKL